MENRRNVLWIIITGLLLAGLFTGRASLFNLAYLFGGLVILSWVWSWLAVRGVRISRRTSTRRSQVGAVFSETFAVRNAFIVPKLWLEVRDHSTLPRHRASYVVPSLLPGKTFQWQTDSICMVRGEFQLGPVTLISGDPFGLFLTPREINASERIIIYPQIITLSNFHLPIGLISGGEAQRHLTQNVTTNAAGVREYVPGDSINRVHWKSTARRGKLIVKEFELDPLVDIWIMVDFSSEAQYEAPSVQRLAGAGTIIPQGEGLPASTEEYAAVIAASLAAHFIDAERAIGFATYMPERKVFLPERGHRQLTQILETLAVARSRSDISLEQMLSLEAPHLSRGATLLLITSNQNPSWTKELQHISQRGIRPVCIYIDPTSFGASGTSDELLGMLEIIKTPTIHIKEGTHLQSALESRPI